MKSNPSHIIPADQEGLKIYTLGRFEVLVDDIPIAPKSWGREKTIKLFQYLICNRRRALHKEQIIDGLWPDAHVDAGNRDFKVALHGINKVIEPNRKTRSDPRFIIRQGLTYRLDLKYIWIDVDEIDRHVEIGNNAASTEEAINGLSVAANLYNGPFLPNRLYEDWSSAERERIQVIALSAILSLAQIMIDKNPMESIRLCNEALTIDKTWEDAYRILMEAYISNGNRPQALKTFVQCEQVLEAEFGISPLPRTTQLLKSIEAIA